VEKKLWRYLRDRRLARAKFRRQHPIGPYIVDFYCDEARLAIELDGGGHGHEEEAAYDALRTSELAKLGIRVLRFWNNDVTGNLDGVLKTILDALGESPPSP